jgi:Flp pilus assembly protein TadD
MKTQNLRGFAIVAAAGVFLAGCDLLKDLEYTVEPNPLEMHGDSVKVTVTAKVPPKGFKKKAYAEITPMLGDKAFKMEAYQGEKAVGNGKKIPFKAGGTIKYTDVIAYSPDLENADFMVKIVATKGEGGSKKKNYDSDKLADGTIITPYLVMGDDKPILGKDAFERITTHEQEAIIHYGKNQSNVKGGELKDQDIKDMDAFIAAAVANPKITMKSMRVMSYASPEGEISLNANLADERAASAVAAYGMRVFKRNKFDAGTQEGFYTKQPKGEDWEGFKELMQASNIEDKNLILRVLEMYSDLNKREQEIRNLAKTYKVVEKEILPKLRRSQMAIIYDLEGKSDAELTALAKSNPDSLLVEELLFAATLTNDLNEKLRIYKECERIYAKDWRGANNVGYIYMLQNKLSDAEAQFQKASGLEENGVVKNNLGICARLKGDRQKATDLLGEASGAGDEVNYNMGIINIQNGDYGSAVSNMGSYETFNKALAQVLNGENEAALKTVDASDDKDSAMGYYLKAIIGARTSNADMMKNNLTSAIGKDGSLKAKAQNDREFIKYFEDSGFQSVTN